MSGTASSHRLTHHVRTLAVASFASGTLLALALGASPARAAGASQTPTAPERATFIALTCAEPKAQPHGTYACARLIGHGDAGLADSSFGFTAIAYGSFTRAGTDQAYLTYASTLEPHANNFGGGILFQRTAGRWSLVRWYPGGQFDDCVAVPGGSRQRMLCLSGFLAQGVSSSTVALRTVPDSASPAAQRAATKTVLSAEDERGVSASSQSFVAACTQPPASYESVLLSIDSLERASGGDIARSRITYATPGAAAAACRGGTFPRIRTASAVVRYRLQGDTVQVHSPLRFAAAP